MKFEFYIESCPIGINMKSTAFYNEFMETVEKLAEMMYLSNCCNQYNKSYGISNIFDTAMAEFHHQKVKGAVYNEELEKVIRHLHTTKIKYAVMCQEELDRKIKAAHGAAVQ